MRRFGFEKLQNFDKEKWQALRREAEKQIKLAAAPISGSDNDRYMIRAALANAKQLKWIISSALTCKMRRPRGRTANTAL